MSLLLAQLVWHVKWSRLFCSQSAAQVHPYHLFPCSLPVAVDEAVLLHASDSY